MQAFVLLFKRPTIHQLKIPVGSIFINLRVHEPTCAGYT